MNEEEEEVKTWKDYKKRKAEKLLEQFNTKKARLDNVPAIFANVCAFVSTGFLAVEVKKVRLCSGFHDSQRVRKKFVWTTKRYRHC
jgi:hypothetical protein